MKHTGYDTLEVNTYEFSKIIADEQPDQQIEVQVNTTTINGRHRALVELVCMNKERLLATLEDLEHALAMSMDFDRKCMAFHTEMGVQRARFQMERDFEALDGLYSEIFQLADRTQNPSWMANVRQANQDLKTFKTSID